MIRQGAEAALGFLPGEQDQLRVSGQEANLELLPRCFWGWPASGAPGQDYMRQWPKYCPAADFP